MKNYDSGNAFTFNKQLNDSVRDMIADFDGDYFVTAVFNREVGLEGAKKSLQLWHNQINKKLYGNKWAGADANERLQYIAVPEHIGRNIHWHMVLKKADRKRGWKFMLFAEYLWKKKNKAGSMDVQKLVTVQDKEKVGYYVTKDTWQAQNYNNIILSS